MRECDLGRGVRLILAAGRLADSFKVQVACGNLREPVGKQVAKNSFSAKLIFRIHSKDTRMLKNSSDKFQEGGIL
jgi:hypothetical protein